MYQLIDYFPENFQSKYNFDEIERDLVIHDKVGVNELNILYLNRMMQGVHKRWIIGGNVLFVADQRYALAVYLHSLFEQYTDIHVNGIIRSNQGLVEHQKVDFLIFVGRQKNRKNYLLDVDGADRIYFGSAGAEQHKAMVEHRVEHFYQFSRPTPGLFDYLLEIKAKR